MCNIFSRSFSNCAISVQKRVVSHGYFYHHHQYPGFPLTFAKIRARSHNDCHHFAHKQQQQQQSCDESRSLNVILEVAPLRLAGLFISLLSLCLVLLGFALLCSWDWCMGVGMSREANRCRQQGQLFQTLKLGFQYIVLDGGAFR